MPNLPNFFRALLPSFLLRLLFPSRELRAPRAKSPQPSGPSTCLLLPFHNRLRFFLDQRFFTVHSLTERQLDQLQAAWFRALSFSPLSWRFYYLGPKPCLQELTLKWGLCPRCGGGEGGEEGEGRVEEKRIKTSLNCASPLLHRRSSFTTSFVTVQREASPTYIYTIGRNHYWFLRRGASFTLKSSLFPFFEPN